MDSPEAVQTNTKGETSSVSIIATIKDWFRYLLRRWWIIGIAGVLGGLFGIWKAYKAVPKYESRLTFALDDGAGDANGVSSIAAQFGINIGGNGNSFFSGDNILAILKSRRIVEKVLLSSDTINGKVKRMVQHYLDFTKSEENPKVKSVKFPMEVPKNAFSYLQDSVLYVVANQFSTNLIKAQKPDKKLDIYELKVTTPNERFTKLFTDRILTETSNFYAELKSNKEKETLRILEQRVASLNGQLTSSISTRSSLQDANLNPAFSAAQAPIQKQTADIQIYTSAYAEMYKNLEVARFQYLKEIPLLQVIDNADYPMKLIKMGRLITGIIYGSIFSIVIVSLLILYRLFKNN